MIQSYKDLTVWQAAMDPVEQVYKLTRHFPRHELYGLSQQVQRAAVSIPSNVAEGQARQSTKEYLQHLGIALGSLAELETQLLVASRLGYLDTAGSESTLALAESVGKMLRGLQRSLRAKLSPPLAPSP